VKLETSDVGLSYGPRFAVLGNFWRGSDIRDVLMERFLSLDGFWMLLYGIARCGEGIAREDDTSWPIRCYTCLTMMVILFPTITF
jgi:hypothetical protein